jgi:hypothetical protein
MEQGPYSFNLETYIPLMTWFMSCCKASKTIRLLGCVRFGILATAAKLFVCCGITLGAKCDISSAATRVHGPKGSRYMLSTQIQSLMWDTINGKVETEVQDELAEGKVIDVGDKPRRIYDQDHCSVEWVRKRMT